MSESDASLTTPDSTLTYPELSEDLKDGLSWRSLKYFGAGAIIASVTIGSGETFFASQGGAIFGYSILWVFVISALMKGVQVYTSARFITLTGMHPMAAWGQLPGPKNWVPIFFAVLSLLCFPFWLSGLPLFIGKTINWIIGAESPPGFSFEVLQQMAAAGTLASNEALTRLLGAGQVTVESAQAAIEAANADYLFKSRLWGTACIVIAAGMSLVQTYDLLENIQVSLVGILLLCMAAAAVAAQPDWGQALRGLIPAQMAYPDWVTMDRFPDLAELPVWVKVGTFLGAIGGGTYDYIGYIGCFREKDWGLIGSGNEGQPISGDSGNVRKGRGWLLPVKIDVGVGFFCVFIFTIVFVLLGAKILHPSELVPSGNDLLTHQAKFLTNITPLLSIVYKIGIFMAFFGTIYGAFEIYIRTAHECILPISRKARGWSFKKFRVAIIAYCLIGGLMLMWMNDDPQALVAPAAIVGGVFLCGPWCFAMLWADRRFLPKSLQMGPFLVALTVLAGTALTGLGLQAIASFDWGSFLGMFVGG